MYGLTNIFRIQQYLLMEYIEDHQILYMSHLNFLMVKIFIFLIVFHFINILMFMKNGILKILLVAAGTPEATVQTGIELGSECVEPRVPILSNG